MEKRDNQLETNNAESRFSMMKLRVKEDRSLVLKTNHDNRIYSKNHEFTQKEIIQSHFHRKLTQSTLVKRVRNCRNPNQTQMKDSLTSKLKLINIFTPEEEFCGDTVLNLRSLVCTPHNNSLQKFNILDKIPKFSINEKNINFKSK